MYKETIGEVLRPYFATCESVQILSVDLPSNREEALIRNQVTKQANQKKTYEQKATEIRAEINVDWSASQKQVTVIEGQAQADGSKIVNEAKALNKNLKITSQSEAYKAVETATTQTPADTLMDYIYYTDLLALERPNLVIGQSNAMIGH